MNSQFLLALLKVSNDSNISTTNFFEMHGFSENYAVETLKEVSHLGLCEYKNGYFYISQSDRIKIIIKCLEDGIDLERICKAAGWREFEDIVTIILTSNGYATKKHLRFKYERKGYEIDVLALKTPLSLAVECKRWKKSWQPATLKKIVEIHKQKTWFLSKSLPNLHNKLDNNIKEDLKIVPVILILSETPLIIHEGIPLVPIVRFQNFLEQFEGYQEDLFKINYPNKDSWSKRAL